MICNYERFFDARKNISLFVLYQNKIFVIKIFNFYIYLTNVIKIFFKKLNINLILDLNYCSQKMNIIII